MHVIFVLSTGGIIEKIPFYPCSVFLQYAGGESTCRTFFQIFRFGVIASAQLLLGIFWNYNRFGIDFDVLTPDRTPNPSFIFGHVIDMGQKINTMMQALSNILF